MRSEKSCVGLDLFGDIVPPEDIVSESKSESKPTINLFDILADLYHEKVNLLRTTPSIRKDYTPYIINRFVKNNPDCLFDAQEMNINHFLDKEMQYDYYIYSLAKKKRFSKYNKKENPEDLMKYIKDYFSFSTEKARVALNILSEETKEMLFEKYTQHTKKTKGKKSS